MNKELTAAALSYISAGKDQARRRKELNDATERREEALRDFRHQIRALGLNISDEERPQERELENLARVIAEVAPLLEDK